MKKWIALLLALVMVLSLAACGDDDESSDGGKIGNPDAPVEGVLSGNTYTNEFFGFRMDLDSDWTVYDAETAAQMTGTALENADLGISLEETGLITPVYATASDGMTTINVVIEDLSKTAGSSLSESAYAKAGSANLKTALESMGCTDVSVKTGTVDFAGSSHACISTSASVYGMDMYQTQVVVKSDKYVAIITVGTYFENTTEDLLDLFSKA